jgi:hypothetical protein
MANSEHHDRYVQLRGGLVLPVEPYLLALQLEERGFAMRRLDNDVLSVQPHDQLTREDCANIRRWKLHLLAVVDYAPPEVQ